MTQYLATVNQPGYLPMDDDPPVFDTIPEAWAYLVGELDSDWTGEYDLDHDKEAVDARYVDAHTFMHGDPRDVGSVHVDGPTDTHLGQCYTVAVFEP